jgi:hypothetical protein
MRFDPRDPELVSLLASLAPNQELVLRLAIGGLSAGAACTAQLRREICPKKEDLARIMRAAQTMTEQLRPGTKTRRMTLAALRAGHGGRTD